MTENETSKHTNKYLNSRIYCIWCIDGYYYIGSTTTDIRYRLRDHKHHSRQYPERKVYKHINNLGWDNVEIKCLEEYVCSSREELVKKENEYIRACEGDEFCLNNNNAFQTEEELKQVQAVYRQENRDKILEYKKRYRDENTEKIRAYNEKYVTENKDSVYEKRREYIAQNREKIYQKTKEYNEAHKEEIAAYKKAWTEERKEELKVKAKQKREENKEKIAKKSKEYYAENKVEILKNIKEYRDKNREKLNIYGALYREKKKKENPDVSQICSICNGTFVNYHKKRHEQSKKHLNALGNTVTPIPISN
jgi:superfamily II DNA helicase RecQ